MPTTSHWLLAIAARIVLFIYILRPIFAGSMNSRSTLLNVFASTPTSYLWIIKLIYIELSPILQRVLILSFLSFLFFGNAFAGDNFKGRLIAHLGLAYYFVVGSSATHVLAGSILNTSGIAFASFVRAICVLLHSFGATFLGTDTFSCDSTPSASSHGNSPLIMELDDNPVRCASPIYLVTPFWYSGNDLCAISMQPSSQHCPCDIITWCNRALPGLYSGSLSKLPADTSTESVGNMVKGKIVSGSVVLASMATG